MSNAGYFQNWAASNKAAEEKKTPANARQYGAGSSSSSSRNRNRNNTILTPSGPVYRTTDGGLSRTPTAEDKEEERRETPPGLPPARLSSSPLVTPVTVVPPNAAQYGATGSSIAGLPGESVYRARDASVSDRASVEHAIILRQSGMTTQEVKQALIDEGVDKNTAQGLATTSGYYRGKNAEAKFERNWDAKMFSPIKPFESKRWSGEIAALKRTLASKADELANQWEAEQTWRYNRAVFGSGRGIEPLPGRTPVLKAGVDSAAHQALKTQFQDLTAQSSALGKLLKSGGKNEPFYMQKYERLVGGAQASLRTIELQRASKTETATQAANLQGLIDKGVVTEEVVDKYGVGVPDTQVSATCKGGG